MSTKTLTYNADTASFVRNMEKAQQALLATGKADDATRAKILANTQLKIEAALREGKSQETLDRIMQQHARESAAVNERNAARIGAATDRRIAKYRAEQVELEKLGRIQAQSSGAGHGFTDRMATSALVRSFEGNPGIRSIENTLTLFPALTSAASGLAPLIGGAGLAGLFFEMGEKGYEAFEKISHAAKDAQRDIDSMHEKDQLEIDDLEIKNQKIQDQKDKLSGKPNNGLQTALLEAKKAADDLLKSLGDDRKEIEAIFKEHSVTSLQSFLTGVASTGKQEKNLLQNSDDLTGSVQTARDQFEMETLGITDPKKIKAAADRRDAAVAAAFDKQISLLRTERVRLQNEQAQSERDRDAAANSGSGSVAVDSIDNSRKVQELDAVIQKFEDRKKIEQLNQSIATGEAQVGGLKQGKTAEELSRAAAEKQMKAIELSAAELKEKFAHDHDELIGAERAFWDRIGHAADILPANRAQVLERMAAADEAYDRDIDQIARQAVENQRRADEQQKQQLEAMHTVWESGGKRSAEDQVNFWFLQLAPLQEGSAAYIEALKQFNAAVAKLQKEEEDAQRRQDQLALGRARNQGRVDDAGLKLAERQGQISPHDAAMQQANINSQLYASEQAALNKQLADAQAANDPQGIFRAQEAMQKASADRVIQIQQDAANIVGTTWQGALQNSLAVWVQEAQNSAQQIAQVTLQTINGLNADLAAALVGEKRNKGQSWLRNLGNSVGGTLQNTGKSLAEDSLKHLESAGLKALGIGGKADGSKDNPFYVRLAQELAGSGWGGSTNGGFNPLQVFKGSDGNDGGDGSGGSGGGFWSGIGHFFSGLFGGGKALGGDVQPGVAYDVGEMGRERFIPKVPGTIIPTSQLGTGTAYYNVTVADGVTPEQMKMHMQAVLRAYHPRAVAASVAAMSDRQQRRPASK